MALKTAIASFKKRHIYLYQNGDTLHQKTQQHKTITEDNDDVDKMTDEEYHAYRNREPTRRK